MTKEIESEQLKMMLDMIEDLGMEEKYKDRFIEILGAAVANHSGFARKELGVLLGELNNEYETLKLHQELEKEPPDEEQLGLLNPTFDVD